MPPSARTDKVSPTSHVKPETVVTIFATKVEAHILVGRVTRRVDGISIEIVQFKSALSVRADHDIGDSSDHEVLVVDKVHYSLVTIRIGGGFIESKNSDDPDSITIRKPWEVAVGPVQISSAAGPVEIVLI